MPLLIRYVWKKLFQFLFNFLNYGKIKRNVWKNDLCFFYHNGKEKRIKNLMKSIDYTNDRYGRSTLSLADAGLNKKWNIRRKYSSKIDTNQCSYSFFILRMLS